MPSLEAVEQFKSLVKNLANEPQIRAEQGLPPEEILPPESGLTDDLADLLGGMPLGDEPGGSDAPAADDAEPGLDDLFANDLPDPDDEAAGPSLDDLLGPAPTSNEDEPPGPSLDDLLGPPPDAQADDADPAGLDDLFGEPTLAPDAGGDDPLADLLGTSLDEPTTEAGAPSDPFGSDDLLGGPGDLGDTPDPFAADPTPPADDPFGNPDDLFGANADPFGDAQAGFDDLMPELDEPTAPPARPASSMGVSADELSDDFFNTPGENLFPEPGGGADDEFQFAGDGVDADFPELAGFADTREEDVEAFDADAVSDEFGLGDFESQFGITADDHTDPELLNPAQSIDMEIEAAQKTLSLTEDEFMTVQVVLGNLPLNLKLAVEELIGEKEMVFEDLDKVVGLLVNRAPVRTIASAVGRILGRKIVIPPGFEKGTGEEIEARHATLWFNMRTIMFPIVRVSLVVSAIAAVLVLLGWNFLYKPLRANDLYDKGLAQAKLYNGAEADDLFAQAYYEWPVQDRFYQYADAYQDTGDFERERRKYLELLNPTVRPFEDRDKARIKTLFADKLAPLPDGLKDDALKQRLDAKKAALDAWYNYVVRVLSEGKDSSLLLDSDVKGEVVWGNPVEKGVLAYSQFETDFGFDGRDRNAHYQRADKVLEALFQSNPNHRAALLRKADNQLAWTEDLSEDKHLEEANKALSLYMQTYGKDADVTWRFVRLFLISDNEPEILALEKGVLLDKKLKTDGEVVARLAQWLLDRNAARKEAESHPAETMKTLDEEYGIRPAPVAEASTGAETTAGNAAASDAAAAAHSLARSEAAASGSGGEAKAPAPFDPPYKYPNSSEPYRPDYLDQLETLILRAMDTQMELPELHYQLSRYYRALGDPSQEKTALAAADTYFQRLKPSLLRLNDRSAMRVATLNRIGEVFVHLDQPLQAEQYFLQAQTQLEAGLQQKLLVLDPQSAQVYRNLGDLYYQQTPGTALADKNPGGWVEAQALYEKAAAGRIEDPNVTFHLGVIKYERQDYPGAVKEFFELDKSSLWRDNWNLLYAMANALFRNGNYFAAEGYYRELLTLLLDKRSRIATLDVAGRKTHKALAQRMFEVWNNLGATLYRGAHTFKAGTKEFREALQALTTAQGMAVTLGLDLYGSHAEFDITAVNDGNLQQLRDEQAAIVAQTRKDKGLVEANLKVLSLVETTPPGRRTDLVSELEIFPALPLELDQVEAP